METEGAKAGYLKCPHCGELKSNVYQHQKICQKSPDRQGGGVRKPQAVAVRKKAVAARPSREAAPTAVLMPSPSLPRQIRALRDACNTLLEAFGG